MYIVIFMGKKKEDLEEIETLGDVLKAMVGMMRDKDCNWYDIGSAYENKEAFIKDVDAFMGDNADGYVIGVDIENDSFEIMHLKYEWVIRT